MKILKMTKEEIIAHIKKEGCTMLKDKLDGTETKYEIVEYLIKCKCPKIKKLLV